MPKPTTTILFLCLGARGYFASSSSGSWPFTGVLPTCMPGEESAHDMIADWNDSGVSLRVSTQNYVVSIKYSGIERSALTIAQTSICKRRDGKNKETK